MDDHVYVLPKRYAMKLLCIVLVVGALFLQTGPSLDAVRSVGERHPANEQPVNADWPTYGGNPAGNRYSPLMQINAQNVGKLQRAWTFDTGENNDSTERGMDIQCQPIVVAGVLYGTTPRMKLFAVDAATGKRRWTFDPFAEPDKKPRFHPVRGVVYWEDGGIRVR